MREPGQTPSATGRPLRVLIVAPSLDILGGQAVQAAALRARLEDEPVLEVGFLPINPRLPGALRKLQTIKYVRTLVTSLLYVATLLTQVFKFDIIHVFSASYFSFLLAPTPAILIGKLYGKKVLLNYHSGEAQDHLQRWRRTSLPTIRLADIVVVPSQYLVRVFAGFGLPAKPIYNLIDIEKFRFRERRPLRPVFLSNRNFEKHYGVDDVLRSFALIHADVPEASLTIAGDGPERDALEQLASQLKVNARFLGRVDHEQIGELYDQADIFLNASRIDNQPLSILESFASGLPVVTTAAGGIADMVTNESTGLLVPCGDYAQLAAKAKRVLADGELARNLVLEAHRSCASYSWAVVRDQWLAVYEGLADSRLNSTVAPEREWRSSNQSS